MSSNPTGPTGPADHPADLVDDLRSAFAELAARVDSLERENAELHARIVATDGPSTQTRGLGTSPRVPLPAGEDRMVERRTGLTRRHLLLGGAGAAAAGAATVVAGVTPAAAVNGQPILQGQAAVGSTSTAIYTSGGDHGYALFLSGEGGGLYANTYGGTSGFPLSTPEKPAIKGDNQDGAGVVGLCHSGWGGYFASVNNTGVTGFSPASIGVEGRSTTGTGVSAYSDSGSAVTADCLHGTGILALSNNTAVRGVTGGGTTSNAILGSSSGAGVAGRFEVTAASNSTAACYGVTAGSGQGVKGNATGTGNGVVGTATNGVGGQFSGNRAAINLGPTKGVGRPTTGAHSKGDLVLDSAGALFLCTTAGTPGTWVKVTVTAA